MLPRAQGRIGHRYTFAQRAHFRSRPPARRGQDRKVGPAQIAVLDQIPEAGILSVPQIRQRIAESSLDMDPRAIDHALMLLTRSGRLRRVYRGVYTRSREPQQIEA